ncbi:MAG: DNA repair protein RecN [Candidatus Kuenenia sp.]|nr:DNA repair protein RecN [Candidatus Kuenenia hertensis]
MLQELYISNFVLIDKVTIKLSEQLNVFSGATGVGKSLVIGALNFILGGRFTQDIVRNGKDEATVIGKFYVKDGSLLEYFKKLLDSTNLEEELLVQRSIDSNGRSRCRLNNVPITVTTLKEIGESLVNIHGQHEHETLLRGINQLYILDDFGGISPLREEFSSLHKQIKEKVALLDELKNNQHERREKIDLYSFQIEEIEKAQLRAGEKEELEKEKSILNNAEKIYNVASSCYSQLYEASDAIYDTLKSITREIQSVAKFDEDLGKISDSCSQSLYQIEDIAFSLGKYKENFSYDPQKLSYIEERLDTIRKLTSKYGNTIEDVLSYRNETETKLKQLSDEGSNVERLDEEFAALLKLLKQKGRELNKKRLSVAEKLAPLINRELGDLGIPHGEFQVEIKSPFLHDNGEVSVLDTNSSGLTQIDFLISPNPGESLKPLRKIASGGEISRVMLALKHQLAKVDKTPVLVFDEIDANIGGRMGEVIGEKLSSIAKSHQVICITHLPQIASYADEHWKVTKFVKKGKTYSTIENLTGEHRIEEIADMIRGTEKTDITRKQAREMLRDAKKKTKAKI